MFKFELARLFAAVTLSCIILLAMQLPTFPADCIDRSYSLRDANVEVTSLDIAPHGAFLVAGTSNGMVLLFDLSNPSEQKDGLLIGQIRARGMHTNLILSVRFSEDARFIFAGVTKGSSEMLAIDLGRVLVEWDADAGIPNKSASDTFQQLLLRSMITFSFSDAKLRGFGAVARIDHTGSANPHFRVGARYRLACGRGIKNVHIWHFTAGYLAADDAVSAGERQLHGKWEYVCDVASNGNTITHIEFREGGNELLCKSAGVCIRLWQLNASEVSPSAENQVTGDQVTAEQPEDKESSSGSADERPTAETGAADAAGTPTVGDRVPPSGYVLRPSYVDVANSQDIKCLLPVGAVAYGGTYQFAVLNTGAPKEANRDVLELPERYSGDGSTVGTVSASAAAGALGAAGRGRRITREIEQVISCDAGQHALVLCADGGVVYYSAGAVPGDGSAEGGAAVLLELPSLSRAKEQQQHPGSWALRRVGQDGWLVLLRALSNGVSGEVTVECKLLSDFLPDWSSSRPGLAGWSTGGGITSTYYVDDTFHAEQLEARRAWRRRQAEGNKSVRKGKPAAARAAGEPRAGSRVEEEGEGQGAGSEQPPLSAGKGKRRTALATSGSEKSPAGVDELEGGATSFVTPAAAQTNNSARHNKISPYEDATNRLASGAHSPTALPTVQSGSRSSGRSRYQAGAYSSLARLRALRDDDDEVEQEGREVPKQQSAPRMESVPQLHQVVKTWAPLSLGPPPKVRRLQPVSTVLPKTVGGSTAAVAAATNAVEKVMAAWLMSGGYSGDDVLLGCAGHVLGACALQRVSAILSEQLRLRDLYAREVAASLRKLAGSSPQLQAQSECSIALRRLADVYRSAAVEMVERQQLEFRGACAADAIVSQQPFASGVWDKTTKSSVPGTSCVRYRYESLFSAAESLPLQLASLLSA